MSNYTAALFNNEFSTHKGVIADYNDNDSIFVSGYPLSVKPDMLIYSKYSSSDIIYKTKDIYLSGNIICDKFTSKRLQVFTELLLGKYYIIFDKDIQIFQLIGDVNYVNQESFGFVTIIKNNLTYRLIYTLRSENNDIIWHKPIGINLYPKNNKFLLQVNNNGFLSNHVGQTGDFMKTDTEINNTKLHRYMSVYTSSLSRFICRIQYIDSKLVGKTDHIDFSTVNGSYIIVGSDIVLKTYLTNSSNTGNLVEAVKLTKYSSYIWEKLKLLFTSVLTDNLVEYSITMEDKYVYKYINDLYITDKLYLKYRYLYGLKLYHYKYPLNSGNNTITNFE